MTRSVRPSINISACLSGALPIESLSDAERSAMTFHIYLEAARILSLPQTVRRAEIEAHPLSDMVAAEVTRLWHYRRQRSN